MNRIDIQFWFSLTNKAVHILKEVEEFSEAYKEGDISLAMIHLYFGMIHAYELIKQIKETEGIMIFIYCYFYEIKFNILHISLLFVQNLLILRHCLLTKD